MPYNPQLLLHGHYALMFRVCRTKLSQMFRHSSTAATLPAAGDDASSPGQSVSSEIEKSRVEKDAPTAASMPPQHATKDWPLFQCFFDEPANWGKEQVKTGRPWRVDELRVKSNWDLHKLWFVLLRERNALLTMQAEAGRLLLFFTSEERLFKVEESMANLEQVVAERNDAYLDLETGRSGRRPKKRVTTILGFHEEQLLDEHPHAPQDPKELRYELPYLTDDQAMFKKLYEEKLLADKRDAEDDAKRRAGLHRHRYKF